MQWKSPLGSSGNCMLTDLELTSMGPGPLSGVRVLDLSSYIAGPHACSLLADLGAEVLKVEPQTGDQLRQYPSTLSEESRAFLGVNRSKRGIALDLKRIEGVEALLSLAATSDVLVHNFRPSVPARLGIDYAKVRAVNPRIIYCALTGYGQSGPMKEKAGYDQVLQCFSGICAFQGADRGQPEIVMGSVVDVYAASMIAYGISTALYQRERTGKGQCLDLSLLGAALAMQPARFIWAENEPRDVERDLRSGGVTGVHPTAHGGLYLSANTPHFWRSLCDLVGLPELGQDPNYDSVRKRARRAGEIVPRIRQALLRRTALEWEEIFGDRVPCCAVRAIGEMFDHPQALAERLVAEVEHPRVGKYRALRNPLKFSASPEPVPFAAPMLGQHTEEILLSAGYTKEEIEELRQLGVIPSAAALAESEAKVS
jgi:crotonobetainyl-CoA:carnitine CoA-transferase CaiB-like acyl-CoA transferase